MKAGRHRGYLPPPLLRRVAVVALFIGCCFSLLIIQFYRIQIVEGEIWRGRAARQHYFTVEEPFRRGLFYANNSVQRGHAEKREPLVVDIKKYHLYIDPYSIGEGWRKEVAALLSASLSFTPEKEEGVLRELERKSRSRRIASWLDQSDRDAIAAWWRPYARERKIPANALYFVGDYQRSYPYGSLLGQVLQTIQERKDEASGQAVPTGGLEYSFNHLLKGKSGKRRMMRSPRHSFDAGEMVELPEHGCDVYLTINPIIQAIAEEEIEKGVRKAGGKSGFAIVMQPHTGEIYAIAQYPFFYPPDYRKYYGDKELLESARVKAVTDANEPASVSKAFTVAIALLANKELLRRGERPLFDPEEKMATADGSFPGRSRPIKDTRLHKFLNMDMAVQKSSNIYVARLMQRVVERLGKEWYRNAMSEIFGIGVKTGVELPGESAGLLPRPGRVHPNGKLEWSLPTPFSLAMGHNFQANALQIVRAFSLFANGGKLVQPTLVRKVVRALPGGGEEVVVDHTSLLWRERFKEVLPKDVVDRAVRSLKYVTKPGGGGHRGDIYGYSEAGKTGTAKKIVGGQYSSSCYCASFIGFAPAKEPAIVVMAVVDEPNIAYREGVGHAYYGSVSAAPIFKNIAARSLEYIGVPKDDPCGYPKGDPRCDEERADWMRETKALKEKYEAWNGSG